VSRAPLRTLGKAGAYTLFPLLFVLLPTSWLESRHSLCPVYNLFGVHCPGCGIVRATSRVFHGDIWGAYRYNKRIVVVFPLLCSVWLQGFRVEYTKLLTHRGGGAKMHRRDQGYEAKIG